jgi:hypothetical protein
MTEGYCVVGNEVVSPNNAPLAAVFFATYPEVTYTATPSDIAYWGFSYETLNGGASFVTGSYSITAGDSSACTLVPTTYDCSGNSCVLNSSGTGAFATLLDCQASCGTFDIINGNIVNSNIYGTPGYFPNLEAALEYNPKNALPKNPPFASAQLCAPCPPCPNPDVDLSDITVNVFMNACDSSGNPVFSTTDFKVIAGTEASQQALFNSIALLQGIWYCQRDIPACPDGWLIRPEFQRPQAVYQFAETDSGGNVIGPPHFRITIPHHISDEPTSGLPNYTRGNWELIYVLNDNSKVILHTVDEDTANTLLPLILARVDPSQQTSSYLSKSSFAARVNPIQQTTVRCQTAKYYPNGAKSGKPTWLTRF